MRKYNESLPIFEKLILAQPNNVLFLDMLGSNIYALALVGKGNYTDAMSYIDRALKFSNDVIALGLKGATLRQMNRNAEALINLDRALTIDPNNIDAMYYKSGTLLDLKKYDEALHLLDKLLSISPKYEVAYRDKGSILLMNLGRYQEALANYEKALTVDSKDTDAKYGKGLSLYALGDYKQSLASLDQVLAVKPNYPKAIQAKELAQQALSNESNSKLASESLKSGVELFKAKEFEEAIKTVDNVLSIDPNSIQALSIKGTSLDSLGRPKEAVTYFDRVLSIDPNNVAALEYKGAFLDSIGRYSEALTYYDKSWIRP